MGLLHWQCLSEGWGVSSSAQPQCSIIWNWFIKDNTGRAGRARAAEARGLCDSPCFTLRNSNLQREPKHHTAWNNLFRNFLTIDTCFLWVTMDFRVSFRAITKYFSLSMALVNKETWSLLDVHLESVHSEMCILVPREGKLFAKCMRWRVLLLLAAEMLTVWSISRSQNSQATLETSFSSKHKVCLHLLQPTSLCLCCWS